MPRRSIRWSCGTCTTSGRSTTWDSWMRSMRTARGRMRTITIITGTAKRRCLPLRASQSPVPGGQAQVGSYQGSAATGGMEILIGIAAIVLGILSLIFVGSWVLALVGFIAVGAALLMVSATFSGTIMRLFTTTA